MTRPPVCLPHTLIGQQEKQGKLCPSIPRKAVPPCRQQSPEPGSRAPCPGSCPQCPLETIARPPGLIPPPPAPSLLPSSSDPSAHLAIPTSTSQKRLILWTLPTQAAAPISLGQPCRSIGQTSAPRQTLALPYSAPAWLNCPGWGKEPPSVHRHTGEGKAQLHARTGLGALVLP